MGQADDFASIGIKEHWVDLLQWCVQVRQHKPETVKKQQKTSYLFKESNRSSFTFFGATSQRRNDDTASNHSDQFEDVSLDSPRESDIPYSDTVHNHGRYGGRF